MKTPNRIRTRSLAAAAALPALLAAAPLAGQTPDGFLFGSPHGSVAFRIGYAAPMAGSQVFDFVRDELTLETSDFRGPSFGGEIAVHVTERVDVGVDFSYSRTETLSEFRDWTDTNDLPIEQTTTFQRVPLAVTLRYHLMDRGRRISSLAWVPAAWNAYVGAGAGVTWFQFEQVGDFVDFDSLDIFGDRFLAEGTATSVHALAGLDYTLTPRVVLNGEARYQYAKGDMGPDFLGFDQLDLSGMQATVGLRFRF